MIKPVPGYVLVEIIKPHEEKLAGGVERIQKTDESANRGKVVDGEFLIIYERPGEFLISKKIEPGIIVQFKEWAGEEVGKTHLLLKAEEIVGYEDNK